MDISISRAYWVQLDLGNYREPAVKKNCHIERDPYDIGDEPSHHSTHSVQEAPQPNLHFSFSDGSGKSPHGIDLSKFGALQLPTGKDQNPDTIGGSRLADYQSLAFRKNDEKITFTVPAGGGVTTKNSQYPRSELKENHTWDLHSGTSSIAGTVSIDKPPKNGTVTFSQIHQERKDGKPPRPPVELQYKNGKIVASVMTGLNASGHSNRKEIEIASGIKPGQKFDYSMKLSPSGELEISAAGHTRSIHLNANVTDNPMYFKAGNYPQDKSGNSQVSFYNLDIVH